MKAVPTRVTWPATILLAMAVLNPVCHEGSAAEPVTRAPIRRVFVPVDKPALWPAGDWVPLPLSEFEDLVAARQTAADRPRSVLIDRAEYSATVAGNELRGGHFAFDVRKLVTELEALPVTPLNLAVSRLEWADGPAVWGTGPDSQTHLLVDRPAGKVQGDWRLAGRQLLRSVEFSLELPAATVSQIVLRVPEGQVVRSSAGDVAAPQQAPEPGWRLWRIDLGSQTGCILTVSDHHGPAAPAPLLLVRSELTCVVRQEAVRFQAEYNLDVLGAGIQDLTFQIDPGLQLISVHYGPNHSLTWRQEATPRGQQVAVELPDLLIGQGLPLRIQAVAQLKPDPAWVLPLPRIIGAVLLDGQMTLRVEPPLQLEDITVEGYRQVGLATSATDGETLVLRQLNPQAQASVILGRPRFETSCRVLTQVQTGGDRWTAVAQIDWSARSGNAFSVECRIPDNWEVTDVRADGMAPDSELTGWEIATQPDGHRMLLMYLMDSLSVERPKRVRVTAQRPAVPLNQPAAVPVFLPAETEDLELLVSISSEPDVRIVLEPASAFSLVTPREMPPEWLESEGAPEGRSKPLRLKSNLAASSGTFSLQASRDPLEQAAPAPGIDAERPAVADPEPAVSPVATAVDMTAFITLQAGSMDQYHIDVHLSKFSGQHDFQWKLPAESVLTEVLVDRERVMPQRSGESHRIPLAGRPDDAPRTIRIAYRLPAAVRFGPNAREISPPQFDIPVLCVNLSLMLPAAVRLEGAEGITFHQPDGTAPRSALFGPLSRGPDAAIFNPFRAGDWRSLFDAWSTDDLQAAPGAEQADDVGQRPSGPAELTGLQSGWVMHRATAPALPGQLRVILWSRTQARFLGWCGLLMCLLLGLERRRGGRAKGRFCIGCVSGCVLLALTLPQVYAELAGGCLAGILLAMLVPAPIVRPPRVVAAADFGAVPPGSTQSFAAFTSMLLAGCVCWCLTAGAQDSLPPPRNNGTSAAPRSAGAGPAASTPAASTPAASAPAAGGGIIAPGTGASAGKKPFDVLVPSDANGNPIGTPPRVYVPRDLLDQLREDSAPRARLPDYLISSADYSGTLTDDQAAVFNARYSVRVLATASVVPVRLALTNVNLGGTDACLVDGMPFAVLRSPNGKGLQIDLPGTAQADGQGNQPAERQTSTAPRAGAATVSGAPATSGLPRRTPSADPGRDAQGVLGTLHQIELKLHPLVSLDTGSPDVRLGIPQVCHTHVTVEPGKARPAVVINALPGGPSPPPTAPAIAASGGVWLGRAAELHVHWSAEPVVPGPRAVVQQAAVSCLIDVAPAYLQIRYLVNYHILSGGVDYLEWRLPAGVVTQALESPELLNQVLEDAPGGRRMLLEFARPQLADFTVAGTFLLPLPESTGVSPEVLRVPALNLFTDQAAATRPEVTLNQLAVRQPADFRIQVSAERPEQLKPRPVDEYLKIWNVDGLRPQAAYLVESPGELTLALETLSPVLKVNSSLSGRIDAGRVDWTYVAEVETQTAPAFLYRLTVDPRLQITSMSVEEDDAERLLRWSRHADRVVVFLNDKTTHVQSLRLRGVTRFRPPGEIEVPFVQFAEAAAEARLLLYNSVDLKVEIAPGSASLPRLEPGLHEQPGESTAFVGGFVMPAGGRSGLRLRVERNKPVINADMAMAIDPRDQAWKTACSVLFRVSQGQATAFELDVPPALAGGISVMTEPASQHVQQTGPAGSVRISFSPDAPVQDRFLVHLNASFDPPVNATWDVPELETPGAVAGNSLLLLPHGAQQFAPDNPASGLKTAVLPDQFKHAWLSPPDGTVWDCYLRTVHPTQLSMRAFTNLSLAPSIVLAETRLWIDAAGTSQGRALLWVSPSDQQHLDLHWPPTAEPEALLINGQPHPLPAAAADVRRIPLPLRGVSQAVLYAWSTRGPQVPVAFGRYAEEYPVPQGMVVERSQLRIIPWQQMILSPKSRFTPFNPWQAQFERWEAALELQELESRAAVPVNTPAVFSTSEALAALDAEAGFLMSQPASRMTEQESLTLGEFRLLRANSRPAPEPALTEGGEQHSRVAWSGQELLSPALPPAAVDGDPDSDGRIEMWVAVRRFLQLGLATLISLLIGVAGLKISRTSLWDAVQNHEPLAWTLLGLVWWLCLSPSSVGLCFVLWAGCSASIQYWSIPPVSEKSHRVAQLPR